MSTQQQQQHEQQQGPPYIPTTWPLGGTSSKSIDIPVTSVFLALFIGSAAAHMAIFQLNQRRSHKFLFSAMMFGFSMARIVTCVLRLAALCYATNVSLAIAAQVFTAGGVVIIFLVNLVFAQRILRATHPSVGWHKAGSWGFRALYAVIIVTIIMLITAVIDSFYTLDAHTRAVDMAIQKYGATCFAIISFLPIPLTLGALLVPRKGHSIDKFGSGHWRLKAPILLVGATLMCFGASYRAGTTWLTPVPMTEPLPSVLGKAPFYIEQFGVEAIVIWLYALMRVDERFYVPDGAKKLQNYQMTAAARATFLNGNEHAADIISAPDVAYVHESASSQESFDDNDLETEKRESRDLERGQGY